MLVDSALGWTDSRNFNQLHINYNLQLYSTDPRKKQIRPM
jgi:hypothetical protein